MLMSCEQSCSVATCQTRQLAFLHITKASTRVDTSRVESSRDADVSILQPPPWCLLGSTAFTPPPSPQSHPAPVSAIAAVATFPIAKLHHTAPHHTTLNHATPHHTIPYHPTPRNTTAHHSPPHHFIPFHTTSHHPRYTLQQITTPRHTAPYHVTSRRITPRHVAPQSSTPHYATPRHTSPIPVPCVTPRPRTSSHVPSHHAATYHAASPRSTRITAQQTMPRLISPRLFTPHHTAPQPHHITRTAAQQTMSRHTAPRPSAPHTPVVPAIPWAALRCAPLRSALPPSSVSSFASPRPSPF